jgi:hypothetical protein
MEVVFELWEWSTIVLSAICSPLGDDPHSAADDLQAGVIQSISIALMPDSEDREDEGSPMHDTAYVVRHMVQALDLDAHLEHLHLSVEYYSLHTFEAVCFRKLLRLVTSVRTLPFSTSGEQHRQFTLDKLLRAGSSLAPPIFPALRFLWLPHARFQCRNFGSRNDDRTHLGRFLDILVARKHAGVGIDSLKIAMFLDEKEMIRVERSRLEEVVPNVEFGLGYTEPGRRRLGFHY